MKKLIETALPLKEIRNANVGEKVGSNGYSGNLHTWWGRTPIASTAVVLKAAMIDCDENQDGALSQSAADRNGKITVFDPFAGFGGIPLAAQRIGQTVISNDLNPVAVMLNKAATEIPARFAGAKPVNGTSKSMIYTGAQGLAEDVQFYADWLLNEGLKRLEGLYPQEQGADVLAWLWARTVKCPNPACGCTIPLSTTFVLNTKKGQEAWVEPIVQNGEVQFKVHNGICPEGKETNKFSSYGAKFRCPACGEVTTDEYVKKMGTSHQIGNQMMAMITDSSKGRVFLDASETQMLAASVDIPEDVPPGTIPDNAHWFSPPGFGFTEYADLFTPRQMTTLTTFSDLLKEVQDKVASDALAAGMSETGGSLSSGGTGALAYGEAVSVYLAFLVDMLADHHSTICSWNNSGGNIRNTFRRQAIPMTWNYAEGNPFADISGNYKMLLKKLVDAIAKLPCGTQSIVTQGDAVTMEFPENVVVCTELPYYKAIGYAHLSDYFYIWMRRSLKATLPELFSQTVTSKEELSTVSEYYGELPENAQRRYESQMKIVCEKLYASATTEYPSLIFFVYHKDDDNAIRCDSSDKACSWEVIISNLISAGFVISAVLPMRDKKVLENASTTRVLIVCRKTDERSSGMTRRNFVSLFKREFPDCLNQLLIETDAEDRRILAMGAGLGMYSKYRKIINADGTEMSVHDALQIIVQETDEYLVQPVDVEQGITAEIKEE